MSGDRWRDWVPPQTHRGFEGFAGHFSGRESEKRGEEGQRAREMDPSKPTKLLNPPTSASPHFLQKQPAKPSKPQDVPEPVLEVLAMHHLGKLDHRVGRRIAEILRDNPDDAIERLERAAKYLKLTGATVKTLQNLAADLGPRPAVDYLAEPSAVNPRSDEGNAA